MRGLSACAVESRAKIARHTDSEVVSNKIGREGVGTQKGIMGRARVSGTWVFFAIDMKRGTVKDDEDSEMWKWTGFCNSPKVHAGVHAVFRISRHTCAHVGTKSMPSVYEQNRTLSHCCHFFARSACVPANHTSPVLKWMFGWKILVTKRALGACNGYDS